jgi:hypothetical protein
MSGVHVTTEPDAVGSGMSLRLLAAGPQVRTVLDTAVRAVPPAARPSFISADHDEGGRLDAVAGCEFVDDRIREPE